MEKEKNTNSSKKRTMETEDFHADAEIARLRRALDEERKEERRKEREERQMAEEALRKEREERRKEQEERQKEREERQMAEEALRKEREERRKEQEERQKEREERRKEQEERRNEQEERLEERMAQSLLSVLPGTYLKEIPLKLSCMGTLGSHMHPPNKKATAIPSKSFSMLDVVAANEDQKLNLGSISSALRVAINQRDGRTPSYENEADVQRIVHCALQDATCICNQIIKKHAADMNVPLPVVLDTRQESPLFSNIFDHVVVYDSTLGTPVFVVETKKPWSVDLPTEEVLGQVYDQLMAMCAQGHSNPFGALTCFDKTHIVWLKNPSTEKVLESISTGGSDWLRLQRIVRSLCEASTGQAMDEIAITTDSEQPILTQSPVKEASVKEASVKESPGHATSKRKTSFTAVKREVTHSEVYLSKDMVSAFVSAIFCSLDGLQRPRNIKKLELEKELQVEALSLNSISYDWGKLTTTYHGPLQRRPLQRSWAYTQSLYLVDYLGMGSTSKAYRALTLDGYDCVVKMFVKRRDDNKFILDKKTFDKKAKAAVKREVKEYKRIYRELKEKVWYQKLNGFWCVIHPYFKQPDKKDRQALETAISDSLRNFGSHRKKFSLHDQCWRHVGFFDGTLYLFDLADLADFEDTDTVEAVTTSHVGCLMRRIPMN